MSNNNVVFPFVLSQEQVKALFQLLTEVNLELLADDGIIKLHTTYFDKKMGKELRSLYYDEDFHKEFKSME